MQLETALRYGFKYMTKSSLCDIKIFSLIKVWVTTNYLLTESDIVTGKSQTEALPYWPNDSEVNTVGRGLRFSRNGRTVEVIKLFIIWHQQQK